MTRLVRARIVPRLEGQLTDRLSRYFRDQSRRLAPKILEAIRPIVEAQTKARDADLLETVEVALRSFSWDEEERILRSILRPAYAVTGEEAIAAVGHELGIGVSFDLNARPLAEIEATLGRRIVQVSDTSRRLIAGQVVDGIEKGLSVTQIVNGVPPGTTNIRGEVPAFDGIRKLVDSWGSTGSGARGVLGPVAPAAERRAGKAPPLRSTRAFLIAQTETGNAFNRAALAGYQSTGLVDFVEVFDGPDCGWTRHDDPDLAHGSIRALRDAMQHSLSHPRCQRAFGAALGANRAKPSPFQGRDAGNVPGATPGLRPDDRQPFGGRTVPTAPPAIRPGAAAAATELSAYESSIASPVGTYERGGFFDVNSGAMVTRNPGTGTNTAELPWTDLELRILRGPNAAKPSLGFTHTHPSGTSFSVDDVKIGATQGFGEFRAIGDQWAHSMKPGAGGWPSTSDIGRVYARVFAEKDRARIAADAKWAEENLTPLRQKILDSGVVFTDATDPLVQAFRAKIAEGSALGLRRINELFHEVWLEVADELGMVYARTAR